MNTTRFEGVGETTPTNYADRRQERPRLLIEFIDTASRQAFLSELINELKTPPTDRKPAWRHVMKWNCGEGVQ
jgi:hypothetical protein